MNILSLPSLSSSLLSSLSKTKDVSSLHQCCGINQQKEQYVLYLIVEDKCTRDCDHHKHCRCDPPDNNEDDDSDSGSDNNDRWIMTIYIMIIVMTIVVMVVMVIMIVDVKDCDNNEITTQQTPNNHHHDHQQLEQSH